MIEGSDACRLIMFDGKCDAVPMLASMGLMRWPLKSGHSELELSYGGEVW